MNTDYADIDALALGDIARRFDIPVKRSGGKDHVPCPNCEPDGTDNPHHCALASDRPVAHCIKCGWSGNSVQLVQAFLKCGHKEACDQIRARFNLPGGNGHARQVYADSLHQLAAVRGWTVEALKALGARAEGPCVVFPMQDASGKEAGRKRRRGDNQPIDGKKSKTDHGCHNGLIGTFPLQADGPVAVVEGEADAAALVTAGFPGAVIATPGATPGQRVEQALQAVIHGREAILSPQNDDASRAWRDRIARILLNAGCRVKFVPPAGGKDIDERLRHEPDKAGALEKIMAEAIPFDSSDAPPIVEPAEDDAAPHYVTATALIHDHPNLREPIINGIGRRGEVFNVVSGSKLRKSWFVDNLAVDFVTAGLWLGRFQCVGGRALIIDLELHRETISGRIRDILAARGLGADASDLIAIESLRGRTVDTDWLVRYAKNIGPGVFDLAIIDPLYKLLPKDGDENNNVAMSHVFNSLLQVAEILQAGLGIVHHLSKGDQSQKSVTDLGSGAGAQSRACDGHLVLREHATPEAAVFAGAVRSWPPFDPFCLQWQYPLWMPAPHLDPNDLKKPATRRRKPEPVEPTEPPKPVEAWTAKRFAAEFVTSEPQMKAAVTGAANVARVNANLAERLLSQAEGMKLVFRWKIDKDRHTYFANRQQPSTTGGVD